MLEKTLLLLLFTIAITGCPSEEKKVLNTRTNSNTTEKQGLTQKLKNFCEEVTLELRKDSNFEEISLSYLVKEQKSEIIVSGTTKNKEDSDILYYVVHTFYANSNLSQEDVKIKWDVTPESIDNSP